MHGVPGVVLISRLQQKGIPGVEREDGGLDVPGVTGVPAVHGVAKLIDGPIFDLPGHSQKYLLFSGVFLAVATKVYKIQHDSLLGHVRAHGKIYAYSSVNREKLICLKVLHDRAWRGNQHDRNLLIQTCSPSNAMPLKSDTSMFHYPFGLFQSAD